MVYPIYAYGCAVLRQKAKPIDKDYPELSKLIKDLFETMEATDGIGLAAPQIGLDIRVFVVDGTEIDDPETANFKKVFINPVIEEEFGNPWSYEEGCLSIPGIRGQVVRNSTVRITYQNEQFETLTEEYGGMAARIIQHEYDHIEGILFTDRLPAVKKAMIKSKLQSIADGKTGARYKMKFSKK